MAKKMKDNPFNINRSNQTPGNPDANPQGPDVSAYDQADQAEIEPE